MKVNIDLILLGDLYPFSSSGLEAIASKSNLFRLKIREMKMGHILNNHEGAVLSDASLKEITPDPESDFSVIVVNRKLEGNFFSRPISNRVIVITLFGINDLNLHEGITLEKYVARLIYAFITIYRANNNALELTIDPMQRNSTGCLFDQSDYKPAIAKFFRDPKISPAAITVLNNAVLPANFISELSREIKRLRIGLFYRGRDWLKANPYRALILGFLISSVLSSMIGEIVSNLVALF